MKITVLQTGGFAGLHRQAELDTTAVPDGERIEQVVAQADFAVLPTPPQPDRFNYRIEAGDQQVDLHEQDLTEDFRWLVDRVLKHDPPS
jgi:hypothetical protein